MYYYKYKTNIGDLYISASDKYILSISYFKEANLKKIETPLIKQAYTQITAYLNDELKEFNLPIEIVGSDFEKTVYKHLMTVPYGQVISYKQLAKMIDNEKAARAVGGALNKNPLSIVVPCHRVIASNNDLTGYAGGLDIKIKLLEIEGLKIVNNKVVK
ncbi:MAG: methylated-DNA--[protein]-cysteine S-methyltransferase [Erysipelothrix sp.]|nr:methylated-DNA--[protein]-cysteine S-methyltransferase [Erysipelothrix sp.]